MTNRNEPVATLTHTDAAAEWATSAERVPVFSVVRHAERPDDADESGWESHDVTVDFTMPAKPNPGIALEYLRMARKQGEVANAWLIETAIGEAGYDALVEELIGYEGDAVKLLQTIVGKIQQVAMGGLEAPKG